VWITIIQNYSIYRQLNILIYQTAFSDEKLESGSIQACSDHCYHYRGLYRL